MSVPVRSRGNDSTSEPSELVALVERPDFELLSLVLRLSQQLRSELTEALTPLEMTWARYEVLDALCRFGPASYGSLARRLGRHRTSVAATIANLENSQFVGRTLAGGHSQRWIVEVTGRGELAAERAERALTRVDPIGTADRYALLSVLRELDGIDPR
ncbi:MarR family winged helix-turn-helix transcriptional regulator [Rhodococcus sp. 077-4]|uniref:MarR family winged helix-turn-helix transcriptional regulator n=1 Tax=Rhodococcus sp. 077-4 TaxID=2789271 RepID=UPI0039F4C4CB